MTQTIVSRVGEGMVLEQNGEIIFRLVVARIDFWHVCLSIDKPADGFSEIAWRREKFKRIPNPNAPDDFFDSDDYIPEFF